MRENAVGEKLLGHALAVHRTLGPGLLESAYEACLAYELTKAGLHCQRQLAMPLRYGDMQLELGYRLDLLVEECVVVEVKAVERLADVHRRPVAQLSQAGRLSAGLCAQLQCRRPEGRHYENGPRSVNRTAPLRPLRTSALSAVK